MTQLSIYERLERAVEERKKIADRLIELDEEIGQITSEIQSGLYGHATSRERQVMAGIRRNESNKEISANVNISVRTVKFHVSALLRKFKCRNRWELKERVKIV